MAGIADHWKAFSGFNNWNGLLNHPINTDFRRYLIHYGERIGGIGDGFNNVKASNSFALSRYPPEEFFTHVGLQNGNPFKYQVTKYFYLKLDDFAAYMEFDIKESAWIGYVAVSTDEGNMILGRRDILVCWRGTILGSEWAKNLQVDLISAADIFEDAKNPKMHHGFHNVYLAKSSNSKYNKTSAREQVLAEVRRLVDKYAHSGEEVSITVAGHSLGAALATLNAMDIVFHGYNKPAGSCTGFRVTVFAYASPRLGAKGFRDVFNGLDNLHILRIRNAKDIIPSLPPAFYNTYIDIGEELEIDSSKSPYFKDPNAEPHNLDIYLHAIAGYQGKFREFRLVIDRDIALVNKSADVLLENYNIPPNWWTVMNKGMIQMDNGCWKLKDYVPDPPSEDDIEGNISTTFLKDNTSLA
ncbi:unnamed protein product [Dovyalis caffra]|uniref:Phospholipase A1 n=1 Tax=Dovyalis caffra TaxID=77055 RepID=A0AAV1QT65_9ROSI|nr:unnamed protein product [Dovyalis caffra]